MSAVLNPPDKIARLNWARGVLADIPHHPDADIRVAARTVFIYAPNEDESREGLAMMQLVMKRQHRAA